MPEFIISHFNYWIYVILMMIGLYAMIAKNNLIKKLIGMSIFSTAIILFFVSLGVKMGATIPILEEADLHHAHHGEHADHSDHGEKEKHEEHVAGASTSPHQSEHNEDNAAEHVAEVEHHEESKGHKPEDSKASHGINPDRYVNPLPHVLMLTAIVVGVATLGVGLAVAQVVYKHYDSLEEDEILAQISKKSDG